MGLGILLVLALLVSEGPGYHQCDETTTNCKNASNENICCKTKICQASMANFVGGSNHLCSDCFPMLCKDSCSNCTLNCIMCISSEVCNSTLSTAHNYRPELSTQNKAIIASVCSLLVLIIIAAVIVVIYKKRIRSPLNGENSMCNLSDPPNQNPCLEFRESENYQNTDFHQKSIAVPDNDARYTETPTRKKTFKDFQPMVDESYVNQPFYQKKPVKLPLKPKQTTMLLEDEEIKSLPIAPSAPKQMDQVKPVDRSDGSDSLYMPMGSMDKDSATYDQDYIDMSASKCKVSNDEDFDYENPPLHSQQQDCVEQSVYINDECYMNYQKY